MSEPQRLESEKYFQNACVMEHADRMMVARRSSGSFAQSAAMFILLAVTTAGVSFWMMESKGKPKLYSGGDLFLWVMGSNLSWEEYQQQQRDHGNMRMDESQFSWMQQVVNDAYRGSGSR
jgi:hypothetical protein